MPQRANRLQRGCGQGIGDLVATGFSGYSRNSRFGEEFARTGVCNIQSEGCASLPLVSTLLGSEKSTLHIFRALEEVILNGKDANEIFTKLIRRRV